MDDAFADDEDEVGNLRNALTQWMLVRLHLTAHHIRRTRRRTCWAQYWPSSGSRLATSSRRLERAKSRRRQSLRPVRVARVWRWRVVTVAAAAATIWTPSCKR